MDHWRAWGRWLAWTRARGEMSRAAYLETYGHRGPHEFELSVPRPAEDPTWLERELESIRRSPANVEDLMATQRQCNRDLEERRPGARGRRARESEDSESWRRNGGVAQR
jgi:pyruvate,water dikinase